MRSPPPLPVGAAQTPGPRWWLPSVPTAQSLHPLCGSRYFPGDNRGCGVPSPHSTCSPFLSPAAVAGLTFGCDGGNGATSTAFPHLLAVILLAANVSPFTQGTPASVSGLYQRCSTGVPPEFSKHATPDCSVRGTDLFPFRLSPKTVTTANLAIGIPCEGTKIIPIFGQIGRIHIFRCAAEF